MHSSSVYDFTVKDPSGKALPLSKFKDKKGKSHSESRLR
jgi:hypothetical protein